MLRWIEKKNWRSNIESCWNIAEKVNKCVESSPTFSSIKDSELRGDILNAASKNFIPFYIQTWVIPDSTKENFSKNPLFQPLFKALQFHDQSSQLWEANRETFEALNSECNFLALSECCKEKFSLENLEGDYDYFAQSLKK